MSTEPRPLTWAEVAAIPGVLGGIARERWADYQALTEEPLAPPGVRPSLAAAIAVPGLSLIAEVKRQSPSQGAIAELDPTLAAKAYARGGAAAISVLTEPRHFGGALAHLQAVAAAVNLPLLRKDFTVHPQQLREAKAAGASAVLLIVTVLGEQIGAYLNYADALGLDALVEVHTEAELELALAHGARIIGVNNRDLTTLSLDLSTAPRLLRHAREHCDALLVAESGYRTAAELIPLQGLADAVLVGGSLAGSADLEQAVRNLLTP